MVKNVLTGAWRCVRRVPSFSLIELLAVISIIALLIGLLLPALGMAREAGRSAGCLSNQKQINAAMNLYANENRGYVAREGTAGPDGPGSADYRDRIPWNVAYRPYLDSRVPTGEDLNDLFELAQYYRCASKRNSRHPVHYVSNGFAFFADGRVDERGMGSSREVIAFRRGPMSIDVLPFPAKMLYMSEIADDPGDAIINGWLSGPTDDIRIGHCYDVWLPRHITPGMDASDYRLGPSRHGKGSNAMYLDGHAVHKSRADLENIKTWQDDVYAR